MKIATKFYGEIEFEEKDIIHFPTGLPGFENEHQFVLLRSQDSVFDWLQSTTQKETAFVVISPSVVCPDYHFELEEEVCETLKLSAPEDALVLTIVNIPPGKIENATVNLLAPVIINVTSGLGYQTILQEKHYPLRQPLWTNRDASPAAAVK